MGDDNEDWILDDFEMVQKELKPLPQSENDDGQNENKEAPQ